MRPTLIEGEAQEIERDDGDVNGEEKASNARQGGDERGEGTTADAAMNESEETPLGAEGERTDAAADEGGGEPETGSATEDEESATAAAASARRGGRTGWKVAGVLALMAASAGGGVWLYDSYGPGRDIAELRREVGRMAGVSGEIDARIATALKARDARIAALEKKLADLVAADGELTQHLADLSTRVDMLAKKAAEAKPDSQLAPLRTRVAALESARKRDEERLAKVEKGLAEAASRLTAIDSALNKAMVAVGEGEATTGETGQPSTGAVEGGASSASIPLAALSSRIAELQMKLAALEEGGADGRAITELRTELSALREKVRAMDEALAGTGRAVKEAKTLAEEVQRRVEDIEKRLGDVRESGTPPPVGMAYAALREKVMAGMPFAAELRRLAPFLPKSDALAQLASHADEGLKTPDRLRTALAQLAEKYEATRRRRMEEMAGEGLAGGLKARLLRIVKVRRKGETDWAEVLLNARAAAEHGGLAAAVNRVSEAKGKPPADVAAWLAAAKARLAGDAALAALGDEVFRLMRGAVAGREDSDGAGGERTEK